MSDWNYHDEDDKTWPEMIAELDEPNLYYEFNSLGVFKNKAGRLFYGETSGCSCPPAYYEYKTEADLTPITLGDSFTAFERVVEDFPDTREAKDEMLTIVKKLLEK